MGAEDWDSLAINMIKAKLACACVRYEELIRRLSTILVFYAVHEGVGD